MLDSILTFFIDTLRQIRVFLYNDRSLVTILIFILISIFYSYYKYDINSEYITNVEVIEVYKNGEIAVNIKKKKKNIEKRFKLNDIILPSIFTKCGYKFRKIYQRELKNLLLEYGNKIDLTVVNTDFYRNQYIEIYGNNKNLNQTIKSKGITILQNLDQKDLCKYIIDNNLDQST